MKEALASLLLAAVSLTTCSAGPPAAAAFPWLPISGTFVDVAYDGRLKYANGPAHAFSCDDWQAKVGEWARAGISLVVFQAVHDARWGSYYPSALPFAAPWNGTCADAVGAILSGADAVGSRVLLSCEFVHGESDSVTDPAVMQGRLAIMAELAAGWVPGHASFLGWYFSSEAYIEPYFTSDFLAYIGVLSARARELTPGALLFASPYGTRSAVNDDAFVAQLRALDLDVIAYQDEVRAEAVGGEGRGGGRSGEERCSH